MPRQSAPSKLPAQLWLCPACGRSFANRNQTHFCGQHSLDAHFVGKTEEVRELFDALVALIELCGPVRVLPEKTRIAFQVRMSFAAVSIRRAHIIGHFVLARGLDSPRFVRVETFSPRNHLHQFRLTCLADLDTEFASWAREAYEVGEQKHIYGAEKP